MRSKVQYDSKGTVPFEPLCVRDRGEDTWGLSVAAVQARENT